MYMYDAISDYKKVFCTGMIDKVLL